MTKIILLIAALVLLSAALCAQWLQQQSGANSRFRGISAVNNQVAWASGNRGTYACTIDGGKTWQAKVVPGAEALDFRDVHGVDANTAYLLSIGEGEKSRIYKTVDGGKTWQLQFTNRNPKAFFDAIAFWDANNGLAMSDPVDGRFLIITTADGGASWKEIAPEKMPPALAGESAFAASGTCLITQGKSNVWLGSGGGGKARVYHSTDKGQTWTVADTPIAVGNASSGIFSLAFKDARNGIAVGGDYQKEREAGDNLAITNDGGKTWTLVKDSRLGGFRSGVVYLPNKNKLTLVAVGPAGSDYSLDNGKSWLGLDGVGYHAVSVAADGAVWAAGEAGRIAKFVGKIK